jgi:hypothetical protein
MIRGSWRSGRRAELLSEGGEAGRPPHPSRQDSL